MKITFIIALGMERKVCLCLCAGDGAVPTARDPKGFHIQDELLRYHGEGASVLLRQCMWTS